MTSSSVGAFRRLHHRLQKLEVAERVAGAGEKEHGDVDAVEMGVAQLLLPAGRVQGIAEKDESLSAI